MGTPENPVPRDLRRARILRLVLATVVLVGALALFEWVFAGHVREILHKQAGADYNAYYFIAKGLHLKGTSIYDHRAMEAMSKKEAGTTYLPVYVYPPLLIVLFLPFTKLHFIPARIVWLVLNQIMLALSVWACARIYSARGGKRPTLLFCTVFTLLAAAAYEPSIDHDWQGQSNLLVLVLMIWALYHHLKPEPSDLWTGILLAPAILLKVFPGIFVPYLLVRGRWKAALSTALASIAITAFTLIFVRWSDYKQFPHVLLDSMYLQDAGSPLGNHSMAATVVWASDLVGAHGPWVKRLSSAIRFLPYPALLALAAFEARRERSLEGIRRFVPALRISQGFILMGFFMAKWWEHHLVLLLPPYFLALRFLFVEKVRWRLPAVLVATSALIVALGRHPLVGELLVAPKWNTLRDDLLQWKRLGILALGGSLELMIFRLKRLATVSPPLPVEEVPEPAPPIPLAAVE